MKKTNMGELFENRIEVSDSDRALLTGFFSEFDSHCRLAVDEKKRMRRDFEWAIEYYLSVGVSVSDAVQRMDVKNLAGFYVRPPVLWYALDNAAKIYPLSMEHGRMTVFRMSVYLKGAVVPELLQVALHFTIKRFPSFATTLKKGFFWHYLDTSKMRYVIEPESDAPCKPLPVSHSFSQSFRVMYFANRISVEFFHGLTDGAGGMTFLKVLVSEYLRLSGVEIARDDTLWDVNEIPQNEEFENEFRNVERRKSGSGFVQKKALQMSGKISRRKIYRILHFKMDASKLKEASRKRGCTVTEYLVWTLLKSARAATDEMKGDLNLQVPVNMRKLYPSKTVRNFAMYCGIRIPIDKMQDDEWLVKEISKQMKEKTSREAMSEMVTSTKNLVGSLCWVPLFLKIPLIKLVYSFLSDRLFTLTLSNLGVVQMPKGYEAHIDSMDFALGISPVNRASCGMVTYGNSAVLTFTKMTADPTFEEHALMLLNRDGVDVRVEGSMSYES